MTRARFAVQGWCPGALRPMASGDGLVVRVRPAAGRLDRAQAMGLAAAARRHGNGLIDLSGRGNLQLRGIAAADHPALIDDLRRLGLIDATPRDEARRNLLVTPFADAATDALAVRVGAALWGTAAAGGGSGATGQPDDGTPDLPGKFGFAIDTGPAPVLQGDSADIRLERDASGGLILRCDGLALGAPVTCETAPGAARALAGWFVAAGGICGGRGRMAALIGRGARPQGALAATVAPAPAAPRPGPGPCAQGMLLAFAFGQITAETLAALAGLGDIRVTPWRMLLVEGLRRAPALPGLILDPDDPLLRVWACTGSPGCLQAHGPVRDLAKALAAQVPPGRSLHVSGCAKGCAHPGPADITLVATPAGFDRLHRATAQEAPQAKGLAGADIDLKGLF